jgi:hypothetical protein
VGEISFGYIYTFLLAKSFATHISEVMYICDFLAYSYVHTCMLHLKYASMNDYLTGFCIMAKSDISLV